MKRITFKELYKEAASQPSPLQRFRKECSKATGMSEFTVGQWGHGFQKPNPAALLLLAKHFGCDPESLFPDPIEYKRPKK